MAAKGFGNMKPKTGKNDSLRLEELVEIYKFQDHPDEWVQLRFLEADILPVRRHWVKIFAGKEKKLVTIPRFCISFNPENEEEPLNAHCPYCDLSSEGGQDATMRSEHFYLVNAIVRDLQEDEPARKAKPTSKETKTGHKDIKSKTWTPVRVIRLTNSMVARMQELGETNIVKKGGKKKAFDISHPKFGCDVNVKFKPKAAGTDKYSADKVDGRTPLTEEEKEYLVWQLTPELLDLAGRLGEKQAAEDFKRMEILGDDSVSDDEDDEDEELDDDDVDLGSGKKSKKSKKKSKAKKSTLDDDDDEEDEDEDDAPPPKKSKKKKKPAKKKKPSFDDDDDDDEDEDEDDDDVPPAKSKKSKTKKKSKVKKPSFDEDEDEDEDEDDDAPPPKKSKKSKKKPAKKSKKSKKPSLDDDDDDWDD